MRRYSEKDEGNKGKRGLKEKSAEDGLFMTPNFQT